MQDSARDGGPPSLDHDRAEATPVELLAAIVQNSDDAIVSKDMDGVVTSWNRGAERMFGYTAAEAIGRPLADLVIPPELRDQEVDFLGRMRRGERVDHFETQRRRKDGRVLDVSVTISPVKDARGRIVGASKVVRDISERKRAERVLHEAEEARVRFVNMAAHELKTPMTTLKLQAALLRQGATLAPEQARSLDMLDRGLARLDRLVDDVLDAARLQAGRLKVRREPVALGEVAREALETFRGPAKEAGVRLDVRVPAGIQVVADSDRLAQVMSNLLGNALKCTPAGGHVLVEAAADRGDAVVRVRDTGVGLAQEEMAMLFQPFSQAGFSREGPRTGTGLGLFICKGIVEQHGGRIWVESEGPGKGATFSFSLPLAGRAPAWPPSASAMEGATPPARPSAGPTSGARGPLDVLRKVLHR